MSHPWIEVLLQDPWNLKRGDKPDAFTGSYSHARLAFATKVLGQAGRLDIQHAKKCGAHTYDGTKLNQVEFEPHEAKDLVADPKIPDPERAVSATWSRKDGSSGKISFDYVVDASGRAGVFSMKYLKYRTVKEGLRNIAHWTYRKGAATFGVGTEGESSPFFEALGGIYR